MPTTKPWAQVHLARMQWSPEAMMDRATSEQSPEVATAAQTSTQLAHSPAVMATAAHEKQEEMEFLILASGAVAAVAAGVATVAASVVAIL